MHKSSLSESPNTSQVRRPQVQSLEHSKAIWRFLKSLWFSSNPKHSRLRSMFWRSSLGKFGQPNPTVRRGSSELHNSVDQTPSDQQFRLSSSSFFFLLVNPTTLKWIKYTKNFLQLQHNLWHGICLHLKYMILALMVVKLLSRLYTS